MGDREFVQIEGIFKTKKDAVEKALMIADNNQDDYDEEITKTDIQQAKKKSRGILFQDEDDDCWAVGMETIVLDQEMSECFDYLLG